jgi:hypothetical protein
VDKRSAHPSGDLPRMAPRLFSATASDGTFYQRPSSGTERATRSVGRSSAALGTTGLSPSCAAHARAHRLISLHQRPSASFSLSEEQVNTALGRTPAYAAMDSHPPLVTKWRLLVPVQAFGWKPPPAPLCTRYNLLSETTWLVAKHENTRFRRRHVRYDLRGYEWLWR